MTWGEIFGDDVMAAALIDRLVHHCHLVTIRGNSDRMRRHTDLWQNSVPDGGAVRASVKNAMAHSGIASLRWNTSAIRTSLNPRREAGWSLLQ